MFVVYILFAIQHWYVTKSRQALYFQPINV